MTRTRWTCLVLSLLLLFAPFADAALEDTTDEPCLGPDDPFCTGDGSGGSGGSSGYSCQYCAATTIPPGPNGQPGETIYQCLTRQTAGQIAYAWCTESPDLSQPCDLGPLCVVA